MATLAGVRILDHSGNPLTDESAAYLTDQEISVAVTGEGLLYNANMAGGFEWKGLVESIVEALTGELVERLLGGNEASYLDLAQAFISIQNATDYLIPNIGSTWHLINNTRNDVASILSNFPITFPEPSGGLSTAEHDQLMALANPDLSVIPSAVWDHNLVDWRMDNTVGSQQARSMLQAINIAQHYSLGMVGVPVPNRPFFTYLCSDAYALQAAYQGWQGAALDVQPPLLDLSLVQDGDTVIAFLAREYPDYNWASFGPGTWEVGGRVYLDDTTGVGFYVCTLTDADLRTVRLPDQVSNISLTVNATVPPVWPGLDGVTLGASYDLADGLVVPGPMHGLIVDVTTAPSGASVWPVGSHYSYYNWGQIGFENDRGDLEPLQFLGFNHGVYTPSHMTVASAAHFRVTRAAQGTVRPFTIAP